MLYNTLDNIMIGKAVTVSPDAPAYEALAVMREQRLSAVLADYSGWPLGIVTEAGTIAHVLKGFDFSLGTVRDLMTRPFISVGKETSLDSLCHLMRDRRIEHVGVYGRMGGTQGVISLTNIVDALSIEFFCRDTIASETMRTDISAVDVSHPLAVAARAMVENKIGAVIVADKRQPVGIITKRDIVQVVARRLHIAGIKAGDVMKSPLITGEQDERVHSQVLLMRKHRIRHLPLLDGTGKIRGLLDDRTMIDNYLDITDEPCAEVEYLNQRD